MTKLTAYITGYVLSILFTLLPLVLLWMHEAGGHTFPTHGMLYAAFVIFAVLQLKVQLYFFLHMGEEKRPRWNFMALAFAVLVVGIVVGGTLWIMHDLSHMEHTRESSAGGEIPFIHGSITPEHSND